jgi:predicted branched-subunit amino acid permease
MCFGFSGCLKTIGLSVLLCACIVPLRMVIVLRYPYSKLLSEIAFILAISYLILSFQVFVFLPIIVLILIVIYYRKKAGALWNAAGFYENEY